MTKKTSEQITKNADELMARVREMRKEAARLRKQEERERREREYQERVQNALEFYEHKDILEKAYQICQTAKTRLMGDNKTPVYDWLVNENRQDAIIYDWRKEVKNDE